MKQHMQQYKKALEALADIAETYQEIASMRMRKIKDSVLQNRSFYGPLLEVYQEVNSIYAQTNHKIYRQETNGKSMALLLTSNTGLYGSINRSVFDMFLENETKSQSDIAVAGRLGKLWLDKAGFQRNYAYFDMADNVTLEEPATRELFDHVVKYSEVKIYHGLFNSIINQTAQVTELTKQYPKQSRETTTLSFIFEPSIEKVLDKFEKQLLNAFFTQTILESNLAKNGSRMTSLDSANQSIDASLRKIKLQELTAKHRTQNKKQQEQTMASFLRRQNESSANR